MNRFRISAAAAAIVLLALALPSIASAQYPDEKLNRFLDAHRNVRSELMRNPDLIYNRQWRHEHPELQTFMQNHPTIWGKMPNAGRWGDYGPDHRWHEADWWHDHDPGWMYQHHPDWAEGHEDWREDEHSHPEWFHHEEAEHREHEEAEHAEHRANEEAEHAEHHEHVEAEHAEHHEHHDHDRH